MRLAAALLLAHVLLLPLAAQAQRGNVAQCNHLAHELVHFDSMRARAKQLDNAMWVDRIDQHIKDLEQRQSEICPDQFSAAQAAQQFRDLVLLAARGALTFFTMGAM
jgi:hypothetical protein